MVECPRTGLGTGGLISIVEDNWRWRKQIVRLAVFDLVKRSRGTVLSWFWLFAKYLIRIFFFWFALDIGLRVGRDMDPPFFLWLVAGLVPWFFMSEMLSTGSNVFGRFSYLVNKIRFPLNGIPMIFSIASGIVHLGMIVALFVVYSLLKIPFDVYLLQVPFIAIVMFVFFYMNSLTFSLLSAFSKDFANLVKAMVMPLFWLSGIIFDMSSVEILWIRDMMLFNPVTFFATAYRDAFYYKVWVWENPLALIAFIVVFAATLIVMLMLNKRLAREVPDVL
jgi:teichoic acid transport system permease protein